MAVLFNVMAKAGEYTNKSGEKKTRWHRCGVAIEAKNDAGMALIIESMPVNFDGWFQMFKPEEKTAGNNQVSNQLNDAEPPLEDIPF